MRAVLHADSPERTAAPDRCPVSGRSFLRQKHGGYHGKWIRHGQRRLLFPAECEERGKGRFLGVVLMQARLWARCRDMRPLLSCIRLKSNQCVWVCTRDDISYGMISFQSGVRIDFKSLWIKNVHFIGFYALRIFQARGHVTEIRSLQDP